MRAHEVLDSLRNPKTHAQKDQFEYIDPLFRSRIYEMIKSSQKFHYDGTDNIVELKKGFIGKKLEFKQGIHNQPYGIVWFDFDSSQNEENKKEGQLDILAEAVLSIFENNIFVCFVFTKFKKEGWMIQPLFYKFGFENDGVISHGFISVKNQYDKIFQSHVGPKIDQVAKEDANTLTAYSVMLELLNCKNITTQDHLPNDKINKKRKTSGKVPIFTYKTLVIDGNKSTPGQGSKTDITNRIHLCRGHFKEYTDDNKLFGKFTGRYWWQPHIRGQNKEGVVMKDYEISNGAS